MVTKRKKVDFTDDSIKELMQETYHEIVDERNRALAAYKKFSKDINENTDIAMVGKITNELLKIVDGAVDKKMRLLKMQIDVVYKNGKSAEGDEGAAGAGFSGTITEADRKEIQDMLARTRVTNSDEADAKKYE